MSTPAGWYPDPQQQGQLRFWDGAVWTEHRAPAQGAAPMTGDQGQRGQQAGGFGAASAPEQTAGHGAASVPEQQAGELPRPSAGYGAAPAPGTADQTSPYGSADPAMQYGTQSGGFGPGQPGADPMSYGGYGQPSMPPVGGKPNRIPLIVGGIVGVIVIALLVVLGVKLITGGSEEPTADPTPPPTQPAEPTDDPTDEPTDDPTDQPTQGPDQQSDGGTLAVGSSTSVQLQGEGTVSVTLTVAEPGLVRVYTNSSDDQDPVLRLVDSEGTELATGDDNEYESDNTFDASVVAPLAPGDYALEVSDYYSVSGTVELTSELIAGQEITEGQATDFDLGEGDLFVGTMEVEPGTYSIDVTSDADPRLSVVLPGGQTESSDDRTGDDPTSDNSLDPYLEVTVDEGGTLLVQVEEFWGEAVSGTVTVSKQ